MNTFELSLEAVEHLGLALHPLKVAAYSMQVEQQKYGFVPKVGERAALLAPAFVITNAAQQLLKHVVHNTSGESVSDPLNVARRLIVLALRNDQPTEGDHCDALFGLPVELEATLARCGGGVAPQLVWSNG